MEKKDPKKNMKDKLTNHWGKISHKYKLVDVLGSGTFGQVVKAKDRTTNMHVAIKLIKGGLTSEVKIRNLVREISILR